MTAMRTPARPATPASAAVETAMPPRTSPRAAAGWAGLGYLAIFFLAMVANVLALEAVLDRQDAAATAADLLAHEAAFRAGLAAFLAIFLLDIVVAWALWVLLRPVHADLALLAAWFRLGYTVVLGSALVLLWVALELADATPAAEAGALLALESFDFLWVAGLAAFGLHLVLVGRLLLTADRAPRVLGWLLVAAGTAYAGDTVAHIVVPDYEQHATIFLAIVAGPAIVGELMLTIWLLLVAAGRRPAPAARTLTAEAHGG